VILLGRLALYGPGAARLHEEIIPVTARWTDSVIRKTALQPYARESELKTLDLLDRSLLSKGRPSEVIERQLLESAPRDIAELLPYLEERRQQYAEEAVAKLSKRGEDEAKQMVSILESQRNTFSRKKKAPASDPSTIGTKMTSASSIPTAETGSGVWWASKRSFRPSQRESAKSTRCGRAGSSRWVWSISGR
jgi:parvulin-like peptidyl-prolyl isomerase